MEVCTGKERIWNLSLTIFRYLTNYEWQRLLCLAPAQTKSQLTPTVTLTLDWKMKRETLERIVLVSFPILPLFNIRF
jgi:hypothetical protein